MIITCLAFSTICSWVMTVEGGRPTWPVDPELLIKFGKLELRLRFRGADPVFTGVTLEGAI